MIRDLPAWPFIALLALAGVLCLSGCGDVRVATPGAPVVGTVQQEVEKRVAAERQRDVAIKTSKDAEAAATRAREEACAARALADQLDGEAKRLTKEANLLRQAEVAASIRRWSWWLVGCGALAALVGVGLAIYLRSKALLAVGAAGVGLVAVGLFGLWAAPHWVVVARAVGAGVALAAVVGGAWAFFRLRAVVKAAAAHGDRVEEAVVQAAEKLAPGAQAAVTQAIYEAKKASVVAQTDAGLRGTLQLIRDKVLSAPKDPQA